MKISRANILVGVISFLLGVVLTVVVAWFPLRRIAITFATNAASSEMLYSVNALMDLRSGSITNAIELLEIQLDGGIMVLGSFLEEAPAKWHAQGHIRQMMQARDYRAKYPRQTDDPEHDAWIADYLESIPVKE